MHVAKVVRKYKDREYVSWLLRRSYREAGKIRPDTLANLSALPTEAIEAVRACLAGATLVEAASTDDVYAAMDWLGARQAGIEAALARRHLPAGGRVLYDLSSSWVEGQHCPLAQRGYSRDGKAGKEQIEYGLTCDPEGRPI